MHTQSSHTYKPTFWDKIAPKYAKQPIKDPKAYAAKLEAVRAHLKPTDTVLEIGCGTGSTALTLAPSVARYCATDCARAMIAIAEEKRVGGAGPNIEFDVADATHVSPAAPFDAVLAFNLLHLVDDLPATLQAVYDQVKPGGLFMSKTVCLGDANVAMRLMVRTLRLVGVAPRVLFLTKAELRHALVSAGFEIEEDRFFGNGALNPFYVARRPA